MFRPVKSFTDSQNGRESGLIQLWIHLTLLTRIFIINVESKIWVDNLEGFMAQT